MKVIFYFFFCADLVMLKSGDDLRRDMAVMTMFRLFNLIWHVEHEQHMSQRRMARDGSDPKAELESLKEHLLSTDERAMHSGGGGAKGKSARDEAKAAAAEEGIHFEESPCEAFVYQVVAMGPDLGELCGLCCFFFFCEFKYAQTYFISWPNVFPRVYTVRIRHNVCCSISIFLTRLGC